VRQRQTLLHWSIASQRWKAIFSNDPGSARRNGSLLLNLGFEVVAPILLR
jgi:hypothetical protein